LKALSKIFVGENQITDVKSKEDIYGFDKSLILLTKPGKLFAMSSFDGTILWTYFNSIHRVVKVFVE
jgi:hypothetical protein